jgi:hypothetical protein
LNIFLQLGFVGEERIDVFSKWLAVILLTPIGDFLERFLFPILEIGYIQIVRQSIKNMIKTIEDCWYVDQSKCFTVLTLQLHFTGEVTNGLFVGSEYDCAPTTMYATVRRGE